MTGTGLHAPREQLGELGQQSSARMSRNGLHDWKHRVLLENSLAQSKKNGLRVLKQRVCWVLVIDFRGRVHRSGGEGATTAAMGWYDQTHMMTGELQQKGMKKLEHVGRSCVGHALLESSAPRVKKARELRSSGKWSRTDKETQLTSYRVLELMF